jgi:micrococcal nuclease
VVGDLDCGQISHRNFRVIYSVTPADPHGFDGDRDGRGCE